MLGESKFTLVNALVKEKNFNTPLKGLTIYVENNDKKGNLSGIFIYEKSRIITAQKGRVLTDGDNSYLELFNGTSQEKNNKKINQCLERTRSWIIGMQSKNGGWGSFDIDNTHYYLNNIPFADHGALLDPPTSDVSARSLSFLAQLNRIEDKEIINQSIKYLLSEQEEDGSWFGRWGTNYIYGTWSVLSALSITNFPEKKRVFKDAINYLKSKQQNYKSL